MAPSSPSSSTSLSTARTPIPYKQVIPLIMLQYCEAAGITIVMPLMPRIALEFYGISSEAIGASVGAVDACYMLGKFFSSITIGSLSDVIGRKRPILFGICVTVIGFSALTFVRNYFLALAVVFSISFLNGNLGLVKSALADITDSSNRGIAFSYLGATFATARATAGALGSFSYMLGGNLIPSFPYAVPMLLCVAMNLSTLVLASIFVKDKKKRQEDDAPAPAPQDLESAGGASVSPPPPKRKGGVVGAALRFREGLKVVARDRVLTRLFVLNCLGASANGGLLTTMLLLGSTSSEMRGLGISSTQIGYMFLVFGGVGCVFQLSTFSRLNKRFTLRTIYRSGCLMLCLSSALFPITLVFRDTLWTLWVALTLVMFPGAIGFMLLMPIGSTMVANSAEPRIMGLTQGAGQSIQSLLRGVGPLTAGSLFSALVGQKLSFLTFYLLVGIHFMCFLISLPLPDRVEGEHYAKQLAFKKDQLRQQEGSGDGGDVEMVGTSSLLAQADAGKYDDESDSDDNGDEENGGGVSNGNGNKNKSKQKKKTPAA